jgi:hypothetical protein
MLRVPSIAIADSEKLVMIVGQYNRGLISLPHMVELLRREVNFPAVALFEFTYDQFWTLYTAALRAKTVEDIQSSKLNDPTVQFALIPRFHATMPDSVSYRILAV